MRRDAALRAGDLLGNGAGLSASRPPGSCGDRLPDARPADDGIPHTGALVRTRRPDRCRTRPRSDPFAWRDRLGVRTGGATRLATRARARADRGAAVDRDV